MDAPVRRTLRHPGPVAPARVAAAPVRLRAIEGELRPGFTVLAEVARVFAEAGGASGVLTLQGGRCRPYRYVIPAWSTDGVHAAWYSDTFEAPDGAEIEEAVAIVGLENGRPFLHCHGRWQAGAGMPEAGHMLPGECVVDEAIPFRGLVADGAAFERLPDLETAFSLFTPVADAAPERPDGLLLRLLPGEDVVTAVERACEAAGIGRARIHGIGSVDGVRFADGARVDCAATEIFFSNGRRVADGRVDLPAVVVDVDGAVGEGTFARDDNPVGVTFEIVVEALGDME
ncbi:PCC domain-containing protein [Aureimonas sp. SK2]|uniref:PCC domain-containing protein n=1 Tax=Aureimonas sp. SK2 TaxID=3015992 RepID=UPI002443FCF5|nr:DUF296 domain-containing protein [Aureimonas sp. SK2]